MSKKTRLLAGVAAALLLAGLTAGWLRGSGGRGLDASPPDDFGSAQSPLGGLLGRASEVARLKARMQELRGVWPALGRFAEEHQGLLPTNVVSLQPYLPANLTNLSDERWEMPSGGVAAHPLMEQTDAVLLQQRNVPPNRPRIVIYGDGHIEYRK